MTRLEKIEEDCIFDLTKMLKELTKHCSVYALCLNQIMIKFKAGWIMIHYNSNLQVEIRSNEIMLDPKDKHVIRLYTAFFMFLNDVEFQDKFMKRFLEYKKAGDELIKNQTYYKTYEE